MSETQREKPMTDPIPSSASPKVTHEELHALIRLYAIDMIGADFADPSKPRYRCRECAISWRGYRMNHPTDPECKVSQALDELAHPLPPASAADHTALRQEIEQVIDADSAECQCGACSRDLLRRCLAALDGQEG